MDFSDLHIFRTVARHGGITRAAERLHRVPSNITTRIRQLEEDLGISLFLREGKRLLITPAGQLLLEYAERILDLGQEAREALQDPAPRGLMRLGTLESTAATRLPGTLADYHRRYPDVQLELSTGSTQTLIARVLAGDLEAALVADVPQDERLEAVKLFKEELVLITDATHRRIRKPADVEHTTLLVFPAGCAYRQRLEAWIGETGLLAEHVVELASYHAILGCALAGMGIALLPRTLLEIFPGRAGLGVHSMPAGKRYSVTAIIWRKGMQSARAIAFADLLSADN